MSLPEAEPGGVGEQRRLGKYQLLRHLATGGMAEIYLARTTGLQGFEKIVVIKRMLPRLAAEKELRQLFLDEARIAATLQHPNVAQVYDVGCVDGSYFFAMEFVHGEDLRAIVRALGAQNRILPLAESLSILLGVCAGIHYAHEKRDGQGALLQLVHRDISPSNILVSFDGSVKLIDFGIVKANNRSQETDYGTIRGKFDYMSPEQCLSEPLDRRSDLFSLAVVLYEVTTGTRLYKTNNDYNTLRKLMDEPPPLPSTLRPDYPPELERIVLKGLAKKREDRYATVQELQLDLEAFARDQKLAISSVTLARFMEECFVAKINAWRQLLEGANSLSEQLADTYVSVPGFGTLSLADSNSTLTTGEAAKPEKGPAPSQTPLAPVTATSPVPADQSRMVRVLALLVLVMVAAMGVVLWQVRDRAQPAAPVVVAPSSVPPASSPLVPPVVPPAAAPPQEQKSVPVAVPAEPQAEVESKKSRSTKPHNLPRPPTKHRESSWDPEGLLPE